MGCTLAWPPTVIGLQHELLRLVHRTTTVKCRKGHVRHATASEQMPLGPMFGALRALPIPPGRDMHVFEDVFMDLDATPLKRSRGKPNSTRSSDFTDSGEFAQRAQTASVPFPRTPEPVVLAPETPFQPVPHGNGAPVIPTLPRSAEAVPSTPPFQGLPG